MELVSPTIAYQQGYLHALEEGKNEVGVTILRKPPEHQSFDAFVNQLLNEAHGINLPEGWVAATELWMIDQGEFIGRVSIRHSLTDHLLKVGGHIGYWIRPSKRNMGYGKQLLKLSVHRAKALGITKILVTCDESNIGSRKIIEANGGILENIIMTDDDSTPKRRYWITV